MQTTNKTALEIVHRLLFRALIEIRDQGQQHKNKVIFHLADLFHNTVLDMETAAGNSQTWEEVLDQLEEKARDKHCEEWLQSALSELEKLP